MNTVTSTLHGIQGWSAQPTADDLHRAWRLDWRFLLPDPVLTAVACVARPDGSLARALCEFCDELTHLDLSGSFEARHELLVIEAASLSQLAPASAAIAPGGWLYAEFRRSLHDLRGWFETPRHCRRMLVRLGFQDISVSWHRPNFDACVEIIPLAESSAQAFVMSRTSANRRSRIKLRIGQALERSGLLQFVVPCFSVLARKSIRLV